MLSSNIRHNLPKSDIPILKIPGMCEGGLTSSPGDITYKHCHQNKRGTSHILIMPCHFQKKPH